MYIDYNKVASESSMAVKAAIDIKDKCPMEPQQARLFLNNLVAQFGGMIITPTQEMNSPINLICLFPDDTMIVIDDRHKDQLICIDAPEGMKFHNLLTKEEKGSTH